jgi:arginyl-tRNA--protein-N-Asp/Glu arginylyltransferase
MEPDQLDAFLALGWFRMHQTIFTTEALLIDNKMFPVIWLRVRLLDFELGRTYRSIRKRNGQLHLDIQKAVISPQHASLYDSYKESVSFEIAPSLEWLLYGNSYRDIYNTYMVNVFDQDKMIGAGFFDLGHQSAAGITSFFDPAYKKYSIGKYMIYEKMLYCKKVNFRFFYPGYFVPGYSRFDYKLEIGRSSLEYFCKVTNRWFPMRDREQ